MKRQTIVGLIAALIAAAVVPVAAAQEPPRSKDWPNLKPNAPAVVKEIYSDVPWHQKLGTYTGNQIDQALVSPYPILGQKEKDLCADPALNLSKDPDVFEAQCMIEVGVTNILGTLRTDTPYDPGDTKITGAGYCKGSSGTDTRLACIEVRLELSLWRAESTGKSLPLRPPLDDLFDLQQQTFGNEIYPEVVNDYPSGFVVSDGTTYAPQMPWYMAHYCDSRWNGDAKDPVCYGDYFSTMNSGFALINGNPRWPEAGPWSTYPSAPAPGPGNHCAPGLKTCTLALGGFDLKPVPENLTDLQFQQYNQLLYGWFNNALKAFPGDVTPAELQRHFPWNGQPVATWPEFLYKQALFSPFQGKFDVKEVIPTPPNCVITPTGSNCPDFGLFVAAKMLYPRQCTLNDLGSAAGGDLATVATLRQCGLNFEWHPNGFIAQWPNNVNDFTAAAMRGNQYGRTSFLLAGVPGMQLPVSFYKDTNSDSGLSIYEQVYNASIFSMYLPVANVADFKNAMNSRNYTPTQFYHTLLMSNHNESNPGPFADGIRGKVLWHNEYRMEGMYDAGQKGNTLFKTRTFAASFDAATAPAPFHNNTCDSCHVRNGSGIPINTELKLDKVLQEFMTAGEYNATKTPDYTFTGKIRPMKLIFFDLHRNPKSLDGSVHAEPLSAPPVVANDQDLYYNNKIMNYYGDSFHVTKPGYYYAWSYVTIPGTSDRLVVKDKRVSPEIIDPVTQQKKVYAPQQVKLETFQTAPCVPGQIGPPPPNNRKPWPSSCNDINGDAITAAIVGGDVGYMHLNGKRLGNLSAIEAIPNTAILGFLADQRAALGNKIAGKIIWQAGSRDGVNVGDPRNVKNKIQNCEDSKPKDLANCFIGRFGWVGDRVSIEDQVANAAFVEMNLLTTQGYKKLYPKDDAKFPIRYGHPNCGPANKACVSSTGNGDLTERDVERMADYARWLGNPTRSEFKVALPEVIAGEKLFRSTNCDTCHVIKKIKIDPDDTMLNQTFRDRLKTRVKAATPTTSAVDPFLSYIGTDLLMHDMGYLSQIADAPKGMEIRDKNGVVVRGKENYVQMIRTPPLKGMGLNRFVTDSFVNTKTYVDATSKLDAACDFLLHDGRACDAIEAAFLHDGPAIRKLDVITKLNAMTKQQIIDLRAFLYSL